MSRMPKNAKEPWKSTKAFVVNRSFFLLGGFTVYLQKNHNTLAASVTKNQAKPPGTKIATLFLPHFFRNQTGYITQCSKQLTAGAPRQTPEKTPEATSIGSKVMRRSLPQRVTWVRRKPKSKDLSGETFAIRKRIGFQKVRRWMFAFLVLRS